LGNKSVFIKEEIFMASDIRLLEKTSPEYINTTNQISLEQVNIINL
jgi:hypothetical protein